MSFKESFKRNIFHLSEDTFEKNALDVFIFQSQFNSVYAKYLKLIGVDPASVTAIDQIPFLPIRFFKSNMVKTGDWHEEAIFYSSGTTGQQRSRQYVEDLKFYQKIAATIFKGFYSDLSEYAFLFLLPSYLERSGASLVFMAEHLKEAGGNKYSGFFLDNYDELYQRLLDLRRIGQKTILLGVTFALIDFAAQFSIDWPELIVMETGGMKGRSKELIRENVHDRLKRSFGVPYIHSEYGMTELTSQAYSMGDGWYTCPAWMKIQVRQINDPFTKAIKGKTGVIQVIDLANISTCSFIETADLGRKTENGAFQVLGRMDNSEMRGCNLMYIQ